MSISPDEVKVAPCPTGETQPDTQKAEMEDQFEVFKKGDGQVDFRTVSWIRAGIIFLKSRFSSTVALAMKPY